MAWQAGWTQVRRALLVAAAVGLPMLATSGVTAADEKKAEVLTIKGTCVFGRDTSTWSAKLTPKGNNVYDADYAATWKGKPMTYKGTITSDFKTEIKGDGAAVKGGNGTFEFSGKYGKDGIAQCTYKEAAGGRGRKGTMTAEAAKKE